MKIRPVGAELLHVDGRRDRQKELTKLIITFHYVANAPKNENQLFTLLRVWL